MTVPSLRDWGKFWNSVKMDDGALAHRRGSLQLWATCSVENLSLCHDDSALHVRPRGRPKKRHSWFLSKYLSVKVLGNLFAHLKVIKWFIHVLLRVLELFSGMGEGFNTASYIASLPGPISCHIEIWEYRTGLKCTSSLNVSGSA